MFSNDRCMAIQFPVADGQPQFNTGTSMEVLKKLIGNSKVTATQRYFRSRPERIQCGYFAETEFAAQPKSSKQASGLDLRPDLSLVKRPSAV
jgi:hypothetical protein